MLPRFEPGQLLVDRVDVTLGQELADPPHVAVQREELVAHVVGDLSELGPGRQSFRRRVDAPQHVHAGAEGVAERDTIAEASGHGDRVGVQRERPLEHPGRRHAGRGDE